MSVEVRCTESNGVFVFAPEGRFDSSTAMEVENALMPILKTGNAVVLDLSGLTYLSSAGLRVLLTAAMWSKASDVELALCAMPTGIQDIFRISGFIKLFTIYEDLTTAVDTLSGR